MRNRLPFIFLLAALLLPVAIYLRVWDYYALNIPKWDDHAFKHFLLQYTGADTFAAKWNALARQHNEHRVLLTRLLSWWDYAYFGQLNYKHLMFAGNLLLLSVIILWWRLLHHSRKPLFALLPVAFIWPTLAHWENMYWGMAAVQNFGVVTLVLVAFYWTLRENAVYIAMGILAAGLAAFSSGNGLLAFPIILLLLLLSRRYKLAALSAATSAFFIFLYFYDFAKVGYNPVPKASAGLIIKGFFIFLGSFAEVFPVKGTQDTCLIFGIILFLVALSIVSTTLFRLVRAKYETPFARITDAFCLGTLLFILGTAVILVAGRAGFGVETFLNSRYKIYSFLLLITAYLFIVIPIRGSFFNPYVSGITLLSVLFNIFAYHYYLVNAYNLRKELISSHFNQLYRTKELNPFTDNSRESSLVEKPSLFYEKWLPLIPNLKTGKVSGNVTGLEEIIRNTRIETKADRLAIRNEVYRSQRVQDSGVYLLLASPTRYYLFPTLRERNRSRKQLFLQQLYFAPGFYADIPFDPDELATGTYHVTWIVQRGDKTGLLRTTHEVRVPRFEPRTKIKTNW